MAADSLCADGAEHDEVHKPEESDACSGSADADAPAQESTSCSVRPDDEEEEEQVLEDEAAAEADGEDMTEATGVSRCEGEPPEDEEEDDEEEEDGQGDDQEEQEPEEDSLSPQEEEESTQEVHVEEMNEEEEWAEPARAPRQVALQEGDAEAELDEDEDEEEEEWLEDEEEEEEGDFAEDEVEPEQQVPARGGKQPAAVSEEWPLPVQSEPTRAGVQWISRRSVGNDETREAQRTPAHAAEDQPRRGASSTATSDSPPAKAAGRNSVGRNSDHEGAAGTGDRKSYAQLEAENKQLRVELGQACYKVQRLGKLREQTSESERKELLARQNEARIRKELDLAKEYIGKKDTHFLNEKTELLQRIKYLEESSSLIESRDKSMQEELAEATLYRHEAAQHVEEAQKMTEKWRSEAIEQSKETKQLEHKLKAMEDRRQLDKQRLRELAGLLQGQQEGGSGLFASESERPSPEKVVQKSGASKRASSRGPSQSGKRKGGECVNNDAKFHFEDPIKPIKGSHISDLHLLDESTPFGGGLQRQLAGLWQGTLRPLLLQEEGGSSGAPGRGKGKKASKGGSAVLANEASAGEKSQQMVLGALVVVIAGLAVAKLTLA